MNEHDAREAETRFRALGYDVCAQASPIGRVGWELSCRPADGGLPLYAFSIDDARTLIAGGQVARIR